MELQIAPERYQTASRVLMIRPSAFGFHAQAASSNAFMNAPNRDSAEIAAMAMEEFDSLVAGLRQAGVEVLVHEDQQQLPDSLFPNNWMSWHTAQDGEQVVVTYPMCNELRRAERSPGVLDALVSAFGLASHIDISSLEDDEEILEGTGSLVLDRLNGNAFACLSPRTTPHALQAWCDETGFEPIAFDAIDQNGQPIYHTNVMMSVGTQVAVLCSESIPDVHDRNLVLDLLRSDHRAVIEISFDQMNSFCGNILELTSQDGEAVFAMSSRAWDAFTAEQQSLLKSNGRVVHVDIPTIEDVGGGSVRCMIAECGRSV